MQLSPQLLQALNSELTRERFSGAVYAAMAGKFEVLNLSGFAKWANRAAEEEAGHAKAFAKYISDRNQLPVYSQVPEVPALPDDLVELFSAALAQEEAVSEALRQIYFAALQEGDYFTLEFLNPYLKEQVESEDNLQEIVGKMKLAMGCPAGILHMDHEMGEGEI